MNIRAIRENILTAKEKRAFLRAQFAASGRAALSLSLNIPGYPKRAAVFSAFFDQVLFEFRRFLRAHRVRLDTARDIHASDEAGDFYLAPLVGECRLTDVKGLCERFEEQHPVGRAIDLDLTDTCGNPISSGTLKRCFLCEEPAIACMREQRHAYGELRAAISTRMAAYLAQQRDERLCTTLSGVALKAVLYEIAVSPKPGLVDRFDAGAHQDMDYFSFLNSAAALSGSFGEFVRSGLAFEGGDLTAALPIIRNTGLTMERAMFAATGGVNTHKGLIFLLGLALFATAVTMGRQKVFDEAEIRVTIAGICRNLVRAELGSAGPEATHGAQCFQQYGGLYGGARQEAEAGFPHVFEHGLPAFRQRLSEAAGLNDALIHTLLTLMARVNDTNILYRAASDTLARVQQMARRVLDAATEEDRASRYAGLIDYCRHAHVSPGGSADLLAVTIFFHYAEPACSGDP